jgi:hypothetical protein
MSDEGTASETRGGLGQEEEEMSENLIALRPTQYGRLQFPPPCPVVHTYGSPLTLPQVVYGVVAAAYLDVDTRHIVYKLETGELLDETSVQFGFSAPVWALVAGINEYVAAVVVHVLHRSPVDAPLYSIQKVDCKTVYHSVCAEFVQYRRHGSSPPTVVVHSIATEPQTIPLPSSPVPVRRTVGLAVSIDNTFVRPAAVSESTPGHHQEQGSRLLLREPRAENTRRAPNRVNETDPHETATNVSERTQSLYSTSFSPNGPLLIL